MKIKRRFSIDKLKQNYNNLFTNNERNDNKNNSLEHYQNLRLFSPKHIKKENPVIYFKNLRNKNLENNISKILNNLSNKTSYSNAPNLLLSKTISTSNILQNNKV